MTPSQFRDEMIRLTARRESKAVLHLQACHGGTLAGQLSPQEVEDVYGVALPLAHFRLTVVTHHPELALQLGLQSLDGKTESHLFGCESPTLGDLLEGQDFHP